MPFAANTASEAMITMADGTVKQVSPFSGTQVWTVPGRGNRPLSKPDKVPEAIGEEAFTHSCAFCEARQLETPPEKARMVKTDGGWETLRNLHPNQLGQTRAEFRRVPNLFEIVSYDYWAQNYGYRMPEGERQHMEAYLADSEGREHVFNIARTRMRASGLGEPEGEDDLMAIAPAYFGGGHDVIIGRRHFVDGATDDSQLASSGTLTPDEHNAFISFTIDALRSLLESNRYSPYVVVFQNWLSAAGASFSHLHKQLVAIDERGVQAELEIDRLRHNLNMYNDWGVNYASQHNLVIAENDYAVLLAGIGHRYPTACICSKSPTCEPWEQSPEEVRGFSDLLHATHAATGPEVACNEEWHYRPVDLDLPMPWRVNVKWRLSTVAGFEGGTKIYVNTLSPFDVRDRLVTNLYRLRDEGRIAGGIRIAEECSSARNVLRYNPFL